MPPFCPFRYATGFRQVNRPFESLGDEKFGSPDVDVFEVLLQRGSQITADGGR